MTAHVRVESDGVLAYNARVFYVATDGAETDISDACRGVSMNMVVGEVTTAALEMFMIPGNVRAELVEVVVKEYRPQRNWRRRLRDITTMGDRTRWYA